MQILLNNKINKRDMKFEIILENSPKLVNQDRHLEVLQK